MVVQITVVLRLVDVLYTHLYFCANYISTTKVEGMCFWGRGWDGGGWVMEVTMFGLTVHCACTCSLDSQAIHKLSKERGSFQERCITLCTYKH